MERIIYELQKISVDKINITDKSKATTTLGAVITGTGAVLALGAAPFTGGLSLAIAGIGAASSVAGGLTIAGGSINEKTMLEECRRNVDKLTTEFRTIVESLRIVLTNLKTVCGEPRTFSATDSLTDVINEYKMVLEEFKRMKVELQRI